MFSLSWGFGSSGTPNPEISAELFALSIVFYLFSLIVLLISLLEQLKLKIPKQGFNLCLIFNQNANQELATNSTWHCWIQLWKILWFGVTRLCLGEFLTVLGRKLLYQPDLAAQD